MLINKGNGGRLGNQMFGYAFGWLLAKRLGYALEAKTMRNGVKFPLDSFFPNIKHSIVGEIITEPIEEVRDTIESFDEIVSRCTGKRVVVRGNFERSEFYVPYRDDLRSLFYFPKQSDYTSEIVFNFRGTDFIGTRKEVPLSFYLKEWKNMGEPKNISIVTDDLNYWMVKEFSRTTGVKPNKPHALDNFGSLLSAKTIVMSRSTFTWWAAFLSDADVIYPVSNKKDANIYRNHIMKQWNLRNYC